MAGFFKSLGRLFKGTPDKARQISTLRPEQEGLYQQAVGAGMGPGAGGAFGQSADYYRGLLGNNPQDYQDFIAPTMREYNQDILPQLSEQFAGLGSGGLSSSGFQNAQNQSGVDLAERLGNIRAQLRQSAASGLQNIGQLGLQPFSQWQTQQGTPGLASMISPAIGAALTAAGSAYGGPVGAAIGNKVGNWFGGSGNKVGQNTLPNWQASPSSSGPQMAGSWGGR